ncbi:MAG: hypothetical protein AAGK97_17375, partial [Bacteroidota bacterium]
HIPDKYRYINISLNEKNPIRPFDQFSTYRRGNLITCLNKDYHTLYDQYSDNHQRNIKKSKNKDLRIEASKDIETLVSTYRMHQGLKAGLKNKEYTTITHLIDVLLEKKKGFIKNVYDSHNNLNLSMFFIQEKNRIINIFGSSNEIGRKNKAMYFAIDQVFAEFANRNFIFDFEGSSIPGVAYFFKGFGTEKRYFPQLVYNALPNWINMAVSTKNWIQKK